MRAPRSDVQPQGRRTDVVSGDAARAALRRRARGRTTSGGGELSTLTIQGLRVEVGGKEVLQGFDLTMASGEVHVIMGPNGSGKSTLAHALAGHPGYRVLGGSATIDGVELLGLSATERPRHGLFLALQHPMEVPGVRPLDLLIAAGASPERLAERMSDEARRVELRPDVLERFVNVDLSGGERKRAEMVQLGILRPQLAQLA